MLSNTVTHDPYAYLDRALPNDPVAMYVPKERVNADGETIASEDGFGEDGFGFDDFLDIINPLQHIPGVSSIYREITGDELSPGARMIGGTIYGGSIGFVASLLNSAVEQATGLDIGGNVIALFSGGEGEDTEGALIAATPADAKPEAATAAATPLATGTAAPGAVAPVVAAPLAAPSPRTEPGTTTIADELAATPIGLEWKGDKPAILQQLQQAKTQDLSEEQLHAIFRSFRAEPPAASEPAVSAETASAAYQKTATAMEQARPAAPSRIDLFDKPAP